MSRWNWIVRVGAGCTSGGVLRRTLFLFTGRVSNTLWQSWFTSDALVSLDIGFPQFHRILHGYVRCLLCIKVIKISRRGRAILAVHCCQTDADTKRDSNYRLSPDMQLLENFRNAFLPGRRGLPEAPVGNLAEPVTESRPKVSVEKVIELEKALWDDFLGNAREINSSDRMWVWMLVEHLRNGGGPATLPP